MALLLNRNASVSYTLSLHFEFDDELKTVKDINIKLGDTITVTFGCGGY